MKHLFLVILLCALCLFATCPTAAAAPDLQAQPPGRDMAFEQTIYDRLGKISPDAVPVFQEATRAGDAGDYAAAKRGFEQVLVLAPDFPDALRRLSYVEIELGDVQAALDHARRARALEDSPTNQLAVARVLLATDAETNSAEALALARSAVEREPDAAGYEVLLMAGMVNADLDALRLASSKLIQLAPDHPGAHYVAGLLAADDGQWEKAEQELLLARDLGMPADIIQYALDQGIATQARLMRWARRCIYAVAGWLAVLAVLFVVGILLSALTLAAVKRSRDAAGFKVGTGERIVRGTYAAVIALTSMYFYASIPFLILVVVGGAAGVAYLMLQSGHISVRVLLFVAIVGLYTTIAIIRSVFTRIKDQEPGRPLSQSEAPRLWSLVTEVAGRVGTRPVDAIYVTPAVEIAVTERGGVVKKLRGRGQRCLILGLGALSGMTQAEFAAILAHEYGHFSNRDTAGGNLAYQVRASMHHMAYRLATAGLARWHNPAWLFINGFNRVFMRITLGASRLQEILADRYAAVAYGVENFIAGLTRLVRQDLAFDLLVDREVNQVVQQGGVLHNLYSLPEIGSAEERATLEKQLSEVMSRPTSPYDSHPAVQERIRLVQPLRGENEGAGSQEPAWNLLDNAEILQGEMTALVQANVNRFRLEQLAAQSVAPARARAVREELTRDAEAVNRARKGGDQAAEATALDDLAAAYEDSGDTTRALETYHKALALHQQTGDKTGESVTRFNVAMLYETLGFPELAEEHLSQAVALDEATGSDDLAKDREELHRIQEVLRKRAR